MDEKLIKACLRKLDIAGITLDEKLVRVSAEETFSSNSKLLTLMLDGQEDGQKGRFASIGVDSNYNILSFAVFERLDNSSVRLLISGL